MKEMRCRGFFCGQNSGDESPHFKVSLHCSQRAKDRRINNCPVLVGDHHAERDGYFEIATVIDSPIQSSHHAPRDDRQQELDSY